MHNSQYLHQNQCRKKNWFPLCFVLVFFLPYVWKPGGYSSLRYELILGVLCGFVCVIKFAKGTLTFSKPNFIKQTILILLFQFFYLTIVFWATQCLASHLSLYINNSLMIFFSYFIFLFFRNWLVNNKNEIIRALLIISCFVSTLTFFQYFAIDHPINSWIFRAYGGSFGNEAYIELLKKSEYAGLDMTNAEFMCKVAKRYTSCFSQTHALAIFSSIIIALTLPMFSLRFRPPNIGLPLICSSLTLAMMAGALTSSKIFWCSVVIIIFLTAILSNNFKIVIISFFSVLALIVIINIVTLLVPSFEKNNTILFSIFLEGNIFAPLETRYGDDALLTNVIHKIFETPRILFFGGGMNTQGIMLCDSAYVIAVAIGGLVYLTTTLLFIFLYIGNSYRCYIMGNKYALSCLVILITLVVAGIGAPVFQIPRVTQLFFLLNLILLCPSDNV